MASPSAAWRRSSRSIGSGDNCVEVRPLPGAIAVRDSKRPDAPPLLVTPAAWREFLARIKSGAA
ncbi:MAG: DUF397 domain-containing protein [Actinomycetes bacterium]|jgi:hypothetical protein|nr:MAG: DUF397 domain-containing protein [Actinomycetota bacterium]